MEKLLKTLKGNFKYYLLNFLLIPLLASLVTYIGILVIKYKKSDNSITFKDYLKTNITDKKNLLTLFPILYSYVLYHATVTNRIITKQHYNPLSDILGGWTIIDYVYYYDLSAIWNVVMLLPVAFILVIYIKFVKNSVILPIKVISLSTLIGFLFSFLIEISQTIFQCGTFQLSDLFYNTLGGLIGALIYCAAVKIVNKKRC